MIPNDGKFDIQQAADAIANYAQEANKADQEIWDSEADDPFLTFLDPQESAQMDRLIDEGFDWSEGIHLISMRQDIYDNAEMIERLAANPRLQFAAWMYRSGKMES